MYDGCEALIGFVCAHGDAFELLQFAEEILDEMPPFVHLPVDDAWGRAAWMLADDDLGAARIEIGNDGVGVERRIGDQGIERHAFDQRWHADGVEPMPRQQHEAHEIAERVGESGGFWSSGRLWNGRWPG